MIDYKKLRSIDAEAARQAVLDYHASVEGNVAATARAFGVNRSVVYDILRRQRAGSLADLPRVPHHQPFKTSPRIEARVVAARNRTGLGYQGLSRHLAERGLPLPWSTIRNILHRNRHKLRPAPRRPRTRPTSKPQPLPPPGETPIQRLIRKARSL